MPTRPHAFKHVRLAVIPAMLVMLPVGDAHAISDQVRTACGGDYTAYCAMHSVGSQALRVCMRVNRKRLSPRCRHALVTSGEATAADKGRYERETGRKAQ